MIDDGTDIERQRAARKWTEYTGIDEVAALEELRSPFARGILGPAISVNELIAITQKHPHLRPESFGSEALVHIAILVDYIRAFSRRPLSRGVHARSLRANGGAKPFVMAVLPAYVPFEEVALAALLCEVKTRDLGDDVLIGIDADEVSYAYEMEWDNLACPERRPGALWGAGCAPPRLGYLAQQLAIAKGRRFYHPVRNESIADRLPVKDSPLTSWLREYDPESTVTTDVVAGMVSGLGVPHTFDDVRDLNRNSRAERELDRLQSEWIKHIGAS